MCCLIQLRQILTQANLLRWTRVKSSPGSVPHFEPTGKQYNYSFLWKTDGSRLPLPLHKIISSFTQQFICWIPTEIIKEIMKALYFEIFTKKVVHYVNLSQKYHLRFIKAAYNNRLLQRFDFVSTLANQWPKRTREKKLYMHIYRFFSVHLSNFFWEKVFFFFFFFEKKFYFIYFAF